MNNDNSTTSGGIGFTSLLTIVFIVLKLTNVINWTWWWVLFPIYMPLTIGIIILLILALIRTKRLKKLRR